MTATEKPTRPSPDEYFGEEMTLWEHLQELRERIVKSAVAVAVALTIGFIVHRPVLDVLIKPYCTLPQSLRAASSIFNADRCNLIFTDVLGAFFISLKAAAVVGVILAAPAVCYQIWRFVSPGLRPVERRYAVPFILLTFVLFTSGAIFAYFVIPPALRFLLSFAGPGILSLMDANAYIGFVLKTMLGFGLSFEIPMAVAIFTLMGVVTSAGLRKYQRHAIFGTFVLAAVITPTQDPVTMCLMAVPLILMYQVNILFARLVERRRRRTSSELALAE